MRCSCPGRVFIQGIRLPDSPRETWTAHLKAIDPAARYVFMNAETGERREIGGEALAREGFTLALPPRNGVIWFYRQMSG